MASALLSINSTDHQNMLDMLILMNLELPPSPDPVNKSNNSLSDSVIYYDDIAELIEEMERAAVGYTSQTPAFESESGSSPMAFEDIDESMDHDFTIFEAETDLATIVSRESLQRVMGEDTISSSTPSSINGSQARGPKSRYVGVDRQSLSLVVKTESLHLVGATWSCSQVVRPNGAVCGVWKHRLPNPAPVGAPAIFGMNHEQLFRPDWSAGLRGNQPFVCAAVKAVRKIKDTFALCRAIMPSKFNYQSYMNLAKSPVTVYVLFVLYYYLNLCCEALKFMYVLQREVARRTGKGGTWLWDGRVLPPEHLEIVRVPPRCSAGWGDTREVESAGRDSDTRTYATWRIGSALKEKNGGWKGPDHGAGHRGRRRVIMRARRAAGTSRHCCSDARAAALDLTPGADHLLVLVDLDRRGGITNRLRAGLEVWRSGTRRWVEGSLRVEHGCTHNGDQWACRAGVYALCCCVGGRVELCAWVRAGLRLLAQFANVGQEWGVSLTCGLDPPFPRPEIRHSTLIPAGGLILKAKQWFMHADRLYSRASYAHHRASSVIGCSSQYKNPTCISI
ncbi:hypothetical protein FIBSPDRAFT_891149 [Athelia psychrophila]|uniref:Uncharacterized protein n=1 Tax=Athelia psychrophila TaxID=1759441 RepID=A0A166K1Z1_9AGAM|nr:hypothetical protein FIBSPDRAFT_891145 [Fibularhizoctonia sp. CBS 109695]KZP21444.1 hypothetical protein FIBSPDRAFT_891149 [Fibularhizoctonia sp. CBS 109695]